MGRQVEEIYQEIADTISEVIDGKWVRAWIVATIEEDSAEFEFKYKKSEREPAVSFAKSIEPKIDVIYLGFEDIRDALKKAGERSWGKATFTLEKDGSFKIDFAYE